MSRQKKPLESVDGAYSAMPHAIIDSVSYQSLGYSARALLIELMRQHNGKNNGHLHLSQSWLRKRGWNSVCTIHRAKQELMSNHLIIQTRQGGRGIGASRFALSWLQVTNFLGLELCKKDYWPGAWRQLEKILPKEKSQSC